MADDLLSRREVERYDRQLLLAEVGAAGQLALKRTRVLIVGAGGLGCPVGMYLAAAGVGFITVVDGDTIERSNLHRQVAFNDAEVGANKAAALADRLRALNPDISVEARCEFADRDNIEALVAAADLVVDCCDNFACRYLINDACLALAKPWLFAAINGFQGSLALFTPGGLCFRCLYPYAPQQSHSCNSRGVLGTVPGVVALHQANLAIGHLLGFAVALEQKLLVIDTLNPALRQIILVRDEECICPQYPAKAAVARREIQTGFEPFEISWFEWREREQAEETLLVDVRDFDEHEAANAGGLCLSREEVIDCAVAHPARSVALYCQTGKRSFSLMSVLRAMGHRRVFSLRGGVEACGNARHDAQCAQQ